MSEVLSYDKEGTVFSSKLPILNGNKRDVHGRIKENYELDVSDYAVKLSKLYIEPTNSCNLNCSTCMRHSWDEPSGMMSKAIFDCIIDGLGTFSPVPSVMFSGLGEPLCHPNILEMVARVKALGSRVEMTTNGTMLDVDVSRRLVDIGIDMLWVSIDGATPESYADIRLGAELPHVLDNIRYIRKVITDARPASNTKLGITFVALKRNIADLPDVINMGHRLGIMDFMVSNVLPYTKEMCDELLYDRTIWHHITSDLSLRMPKMDVDYRTRATLDKTMSLWSNHRNGTRNFLGQDCVCPFLENGTGAIRWDGGLSPCVPLMHSYVNFVMGRERVSRQWAVGYLTEHSLPDLWYLPEHITFRKRVQAFEFSPCINCGGCVFAEKNEEDCIGSTFPTCGNCLWAYGVIQCP